MRDHSIPVRIPASGPWKPVMASGSTGWPYFRNGAGSLLVLINMSPVCGVTIRAVDREHIKPGQPVTMTMHRAKGTEFSKVLLFGVNQGAIPRPLRDEQYAEDAWADALLRERSLLYVAATRARDELAVSWSGEPSQLLSAPALTTRSLRV